jgi:PAS domain S-box-containing protein
VREFTRSLLEIANLGKQLNPTLKEFVRVIRDYADCDAAGIRVLDSEGNIPYQAYEGFSREFYESESPLSIKLHHCMCINVIKGNNDPSLPYYTEDGSFCMNGTTAFLATVSEEEKGSTRNVCNAHGYESVALVPIRLGDKILGLIHIADKRTDMVPLDLVNALEDTAPQIGLAIRRLWAEHELAEEKERLEVTMRSTGDGIIATDMEGKVVLLNRVAEALTGWTQKEALGRSIREVFYIIDERNRQPIPDPIENVVKTGRVIGLVNHALLISRDGTERVIADSGAPIHDEQGRMFGVVLVFRDITELRRLQEEQLKVAKLESIGILAGGIAHDFNNLLTAIMGNIGLARRYVEPQGKAFERLDEAEKASVRAKDLTQQLLTFSKGGAPIKITAVISELIKETAAFALSGSDVRLELSLPEDLWAVEIDEGQMGQVIQNIVINADEAMPAGGTLNISARNTAIQRMGALPLPKGNYVQIDLKDEGIGMSKKQLARLFEPYFTTKQKGSGLGLATAYSIINNHGGYITAESTQNVGTTFHIYLPASRKPAPVKKKPALEKPVRGKGRILVMDDEEIIRLLLSKILTGAGYKVELIKDGAEAIEHYIKAKEAGKPFDAVIMDLTIPGGMGGKEAIKKLLEIDPKVKAIVSSGYATDPIMSEYKKYGFSAVVTKPYSVSQMEETLHDILAGEE